MYIYSQDEDDDWVSHRVVCASDGAVEDKFGRSIALCDEWLAVGMTARDAVYLFRYD